MRRRLFMVGLWLGATAASVAVVMGGIRLIADSVSDPDRLPLAVAGNADDDAVDTQPSTRGPGRGTRTRTPTPTAGDATGRPGQPGAPGEPATDDPEPPPSQPSDPPDQPPPPPASMPPTATPDDPTPTETGSESEEPEDESAPEERAYQLEGGSIGIRFSATRVEVLYATPRDGFVVRVLRESETRVVVTFRSSTHVSELEARWDNGPRADAEEDDDNSG